MANNYNDTNQQIPAIRIFYFNKESPPPVRIEFTVDAGVHNARTYALIDQAEAFFKELKTRTGWDVQIIHREPAQIFHEKNRYLTPKQAPADIQLWPGNQRDYARRVQNGDYQVEAPGEIEAKYKQALQRAVFEVAEKEKPELLQHEGISRPEDIRDDLLQSLYLNLEAFNNRHSKNRRLDGFKAYAEERANAGERSFAHFLEHRPEPEGTEKVVSVFISADRGALKQVEHASRIAPGTNSGKVQIHAVHQDQFKDVMRQLMRDVKREYPAAADIPFPALAQGFSGLIARSRLDSQGWGFSR